jgi:ATP-binding cassette subfamily F protein 3
MIKLNQIRLEFADRVIFNDVDLFIAENDKVGLVGKNGAGKSTLLKVITGSQPLNAGQVIKPKDFTIGYLPQDLNFESELSVKDEVLTAFEVTNKIEARIDQLTREISNREDYESDAYMNLVEELNKASTQLGLYDIDHQEEQSERILLGLGFSRTDFARALKEFSGGWQMRVALAKILLQRPNLVLLDEPTNHLDIDSVEWLESYLKTYQGAVLLISHDRRFLDQVTNRTIEIIKGKAFDYPAPYSRFVELRADVIQKQREAKKNQDREIKQTEALINKFRAKSSKASFAQSLIKKLDKMEMVEIDEEDHSSMQFRFPPAPRSGKMVIEARNLSKSYGDKKVLKELDFEIIRGDRLALVGKNGVGKTTLTKILAGISNYKGECEVGSNVDIGYYSQNQSDELPPRSTAHDVIDKEATGEYRTKVRSLLGAFMFQGDDIFKQVGVLSGGEKARLALCKLLLHQYNFLILDEPTNHLDMSSKDVLKEALKKFDGTLLVVSHDREFLEGLTDKVMEIKEGRMSVFPGGIEEFLSRKKAQSIQEFERTAKERSKTSPSKDQKSQGSGLSEKEKWQLNKKISSLEKDIEKLEEKIDQLKKEQSGLDFSNHELVKNHMETLARSERKLTTKLEEWEEASEKQNAG